MHPSVLLHKLEDLDGCKRLHLTDGRHFDSDLVFFAIGRTPHTKGLGLERAGVAVTDSGRVIVDAHNTTSASNIFAIGDVSNKMNLTPVAIAEGHRLARSSVRRCA